MYAVAGVFVTAISFFAAAALIACRHGGDYCMMPVPYLMLLAMPLIIIFGAASGIVFCKKERLAALLLMFTFVGAASYVSYLLHSF